MKTTESETLEAFLCRTLLYFDPMGRGRVLVYCKTNEQRGKLHSISDFSVAATMPDGSILMKRKAMR